VRRSDLPAMTECQAPVMLGVRASSRASPLPQGSLVNTGFVYDKGQKCGSGLARDGGVSGDSDVGSAGLIAGEPAPTGGFGEHGICGRQKSNCGSGLAREGGVSGDSDVGCAGLIAGEPAPTEVFGEHGICGRQNPIVGAGLLRAAFRRWRRVRRQ
jgi:hypothetical protein